jgi:hypothetical protein
MSNPNRKESAVAETTASTSPPIAEKSATPSTRPSAPAAGQGPNRRRTIGQRIVVALVGVFAAWHVAASFLWIGPVTPLRELVPGNLLTQYMLPWFGQSWSVFAPAPINGDYRLQVRAVLADRSGGEVATKWISATDAEHTLSMHNLFPPRAANLAVHQASNLKGAWDALTAEQKKITELNYFKNDDWLGRMQVALNDVNKHANEAAVVNYIVQERYTDAYAVQVARAVWGDSVVRVQFQAQRQNIIPFVERHNPDVKLPPLQFAPTGWRGLIVMPGQSEEQFAEVFGPAHSKVSKK